MKLYVVEMIARDGTERFYKVGVTQFRNTMHRFTKHGDAKVQDSNLSKLEKLRMAFQGHDYIPRYDINILLELPFDQPGAALAAENEVLEVVPPYKPAISFSGDSECFQATPEQLALLLEYLTEAYGNKSTGTP